MKSSHIDLFLGIDVQIKRGCSYYIVNSKLEYYDSGWLTGANHAEICQQLARLCSQLQTEPERKIAVGIDAPRMGLPEPRSIFWKSGKWGQDTLGAKGFGRHCEVVIKALGIANPQWTRPQDDSPPWMVLGYRLYETFQDVEHVYEVFPSASYKMLAGNKQMQVGLSFADFVHGPKDMLDACVSAFTVHAFLHERGFEVGGGDGLGTIILPGTLPVPVSHPVLYWPNRM